MSSDVYGYVICREKESARKLLLEAAASVGIGVSFISTGELYNFPAERLPASNAVSFVIGDRPGTVSADYLTDMVDYAPGSEIGMPLMGAERLGLLTRWLHLVMVNKLTESMVVAMTECSEIEAEKHLPLDKVEEVLQEDFREYAPPNLLYLIFRSLPDEKK